MMRTAAELGLRVPEDLSVVGFDNIPESALTDPPLTTVDQSIQDLGHEAMRILIDLIRHPDRAAESEPIHVTLPTALIVRRSSARR
jgi:LacI family transcriptional regulator